ncbi:MAG: YraN family protein [Eubacterium sp.]|nr:YraN family protein [Eubacterium sp.]
MMEQAAASFLENNGFALLEKNFYCRFGEIDLIAKEGNTICFLEVKYRHAGQYGDPAEAVDHKKQRRISNAASYYLYSNRIPFDTPCRFDIAAVTPSGIRLIRNAFDYTGNFYL